MDRCVGVAAVRCWIEWVTDRDWLSALRTHWGQFAAANRNPFGDHTWFAA